MATTVLYHAFCPDGFGAAWAAWRRLGDDATYVAVQHGAPPPSIPPGQDVYILDFCYRRAEIERMSAEARLLQVIDHHRTAENELRGLDHALFDDTKSAAVLAWEHFHPGESVPAILEYVMDRDLWLHRLPRSREVSAGLSSHPMEFLVWDGLDVETLAAEGVPILRYQNEMVRLLSQNARFDILAGHRIPVVNAPLLGSDVGAELLRRHPECPFVAIYFDRADGIRQWSLRSREDFDVSELARSFQNGGHRQAAGFETHVPADFMPVPPGKKRK
jgi:uncharacterized protein